MKKIILMKGGVETLDYFSERLGEAFIKRGYEVYTFDLNDQFNSFTSLILFCKKSEAILVTFNFIGLSGETIFQDEIYGSFFDKYDIACVNIVVDHPFYYHKNLRNLPKKYLQFCIDRTHMDYMKRYFKDVCLGPFLPLAGTEIERADTRLSIKDRTKMDFVFTGNYTPPSQFDKEINRNGKEYANFYHGIIDDLIANPYKTMDATFEEHIRRDIQNVSDEDLKRCMENMIFIDLYVRFYMRGRVIKELVDSGCKVHVFGCGLEKIPYKKPQNLIVNGGVKSLVCLHKLSRSKISINVMPWFKDGAHDRVFNAALNGAVNLTDDSIYLKEIYDGKDAVAFYDLRHLNQIKDIAYDLISNTTRMQDMANRAYEITKKGHTWEHRAEIILQELESRY